MNDSYNAILFLGKTKEPSLYSDYKIYQNGTGYIALHNSETNSYILCRILDERELLNCDLKNKLIYKDKENHIFELHVILINRSITSFDESDKIINNQFNYK